MTIRTLGLIAGLAVGALALTSCGGSGGSSTSAGQIDVVAAFYPLEYLAETVGGDGVSVTTLAPPGAEPHDLELSPSDLRQMAEADLVVYLSGFMPAVDDAVAQLPAGKAWDAARYADLDLTYTPIEEGAVDADEAGITDPHFWLDPTRYAAVGQQLAVGLGGLAEGAASTFTANAAGLAQQLGALDAEWKRGTTTCANRDLVTSHNAFGYLAQRYGFTQRGITGLTPEDEPTPQALADTATFVEANGIRTIYYETLVSPAIADTVARETGARTAVLDPVEGISPQSQGQDYVAIMRANLANVREGQPCT